MRVHASGQDNLRGRVGAVELIRSGPEKVPPPASDGHEGRLFPPEQFISSGQQAFDCETFGFPKTADEIDELGTNRKRFFRKKRTMFWGRSDKTRDASVICRKFGR